MGRLAISYRRADSFAAKYLFDKLESHFGHGSVFMDVQDIPPGSEFPRHIEQAIRNADVVIFLIGPTWLGKHDSGRRIDEPSDWIRKEVEFALQAGTAGLPLLLGDAAMPDPRDLPDNIRRFAEINATRLDVGPDADQQLARLIAQMETLLGSREAAKAARSTPAQRAQALATSAAHRLAAHFAHRSLTYWLGALLVLVLSLVASRYADSGFALDDRLYNQFSHWLPRISQSHARPQIVWIGQEDFSPSAVAARKGHSLLARLITDLDRADVGLIAIDINLAVKQGLQSKRELAAAVAAAAERRVVILPKVLVNGPRGVMDFSPDALSEYGFCTRIDETGRWIHGPTHDPSAPITPRVRANIRCAYINFVEPTYIKVAMIPPSICFEKHRVDSMAFALARELSPYRDSLNEVDCVEQVGAYDAAPDAGREDISAQIFQGDPVGSRLAHKNVLIGGRWLVDGERVDVRKTPIGIVPGPVIHRDFAQEILDRSIAEYVPRYILLVAEILIGLVALYAFSRAFKPLERFGLAVGMILGLFAIQLATFSFFGTFAEGLIVLMGQWLYSAGARYVSI